MLPPKRRENSTKRKARKTPKLEMTSSHHVIMSRHGDRIFYIADNFQKPIMLSYCFCVKGIWKSCYVYTFKNMAYAYKFVHNYIVLTCKYLSYLNCNPSISYYVQSFVFNWLVF